MPKSHLHFLDVPLQPEGSQLGRAETLMSPRTTGTLRGVSLQEVPGQIDGNGQHRLWDM